MISTHVLDVSIGRPAAGVTVTLEVFRHGAWIIASSARTDSDGRVLELAPPAHEDKPAAGRWRLVFETGAYFAAGGVASFYPQVVVEFEVLDPSQHYHVPLLLSPFGYTTYRGT
ncbi:MAG TPA: hydroxyisourate hydrolase [Gemmatimonadales bacterium]|nr:hydroxyisourate hydrolase [Gemmatimonadales bacterium]